MGSKRLAERESFYHATATGLAHKLIADRALRAIDGLRTIADIPKPQKRDRRGHGRNGVAYHRVKNSNI
jgi:hypothetical protein